MRKVELVATLAERAELTSKQSKHVVDALLNVITETLAKGEEVQITGFGTFKTIERAEREGRNPRTSEKMVIPSSKSVKFKAGNVLKTDVNK